MSAFLIVVLLGLFCNPASEFICKDESGNCGADCFKNCKTQRCDTDPDAGMTVCMDGCIDGYRGYMCQTGCPPNCRKCEQHVNACTECTHGHFGTQCEFPCSKTCQNESCFQDGRCLICSSNTYGPYCNISCQPEYNECDTDGKCVSCLAGFYGDMCEFSCPVCTSTYNFSAFKCKSGCNQTLCKVQGANQEYVSWIPIVTIGIVLAAIVPLCSIYSKLNSDIPNRDNAQAGRADTEEIQDATTHCNVQMEKLLPGESQRELKSVDDLELKTPEPSVRDDLTQLSNVERDNIILRKKMADMKMAWHEEKLHSEVKLRSELEEEKVQRRKVEAQLKCEINEKKKLEKIIRRLEAEKLAYPSGHHPTKSPKLNCPPLEFSSDEVNTECCNVTHGWLINSRQSGPTSERQNLKRYPGTCSSTSVPHTFSYYELKVEVEKQIGQGGWSNIFEFGIMPKADIDGFQWICQKDPYISKRWGVTLFREDNDEMNVEVWSCGEHIECHRTGQFPKHGNTLNLHYGIAIDLNKNMMALFDLTAHSVLASVEVNIKENAYLVFGVTSEEYTNCRVKIGLITGENITMTDNKDSLIRKTIPEAI